MISIRVTDRSEGCVRLKINEPGQPILKRAVDADQWEAFIERESWTLHGIRIKREQRKNGKPW